jgi:hypothetical protein
MRSPLASAAFGVVLAAGIALLGAPVANASPAPSLTVALCADARLNLSNVSTDLDNATSQLGSLTATADELTRRLGLGSLLGTEQLANDDAVAKIRAVLTLKAAKVLAQDRVTDECGDPDVIVVTPPPSSSASPSPTYSPGPDHQTHRRPRRAPETGDGSSLGPAVDQSIAPAMALYALLSVGLAAAIRVGRVWRSGR